MSTNEKLLSKGCPDVYKCTDLLFSIVSDAAVI